MNVRDLLVAGGVAAGLIKIIDGVIQWCLNRRAKKQDKEKEKDSATDVSIKVLMEALKVIMLDRILYLGRNYINDKNVDADDRRRLIAMHDVYHSLGGNGDADLIMASVKVLPMKVRRE